jgi:hypothetical protein
MDPKGAPLASTDLLEISELVSGSYVTKSITGAEIIAGATTGFVPTTRTLTINGTTQDLSADRTFTISTGITIGTTAITSGTVGRVLFEGTGNVVQESANLFWDNTNARLGIGSATPLTALSVNSLRPTISIRDTTGSTNSSYFGSFDDFLQIAVNRNPSTGVFTNTGKASAQISMEGSTSSGKIFFYATNTNGATPLEAMRINGTGNVAINTTTDAGFKLDVNGTTRLNGNVAIGTTTQTGINYPILGKVRIAPISNPYFAGLTTHNFEVWSSSYFEETIFTKSGKGFGTSTVNLMYYSGSNVYFRLNNGSQDIVNINQAGMLVSLEALGTPTTSAILEVKSTTKGFLPPRMTTTEKNAIATPATGLMVYDTTLNLISVYNGTTWITL